MTTDPGVQAASPAGSGTRGKRRGRSTGGAEAYCWSLTQAAAWVVYRDMEMVALFQEPERADWQSLRWYPQMLGASPEIARLRDLFTALRRGRLVALGRHGGAHAPVVEIPLTEWHDLIPDPDGPYRRLETGQRATPWTDIRVRRADVERLWRRTSEVQRRTKYREAWFQEQYPELRARNPKLSKNEIIECLQMAYQDQTRRDPPSRSTVQRYLQPMQDSGTGPQ